MVPGPNGSLVPANQQQPPAKPDATAPPPEAIDNIKAEEDLVSEVITTTPDQSQQAPPIGSMNSSVSREDSLIVTRPPSAQMPIVVGESDLL